MFHLLEVGSFSFPGPDSVRNEDFLLLPLPLGNSDVIIALADGVGSTNGASMASKAAIEAVKEVVISGGFSMHSAFESARNKVTEVSLMSDSYSQVATTLTVIGLSNEIMTIGHIGDCRAYVKKEGKLRQVTKDHTRYQELIDSGEHGIRKLQQHKERLSRILTRAISSQAELNYDVISIPIDDLVEDGAVLVTLMSDGTYEKWHKRPSFSEATMSSPSAFTTSLRKRVQKSPTDDFSCISAKFEFD